MPARIPFKPSSGWQRSQRRDELHERLRLAAKAPKRILAIDPVLLKKQFLVEIMADPIAFVRVVAAKPVEVADILHDWHDKKGTLLAIIQPPREPAKYFADRKRQNPSGQARYLWKMMGRYQQAWHRPFAYPHEDAIGYALFERRWKPDRNALAARLRREYQIPYGSGAFFPKRAHKAAAAALVVARAWRGMEYRRHTEL